MRGEPPRAVDPLDRLPHTGPARLPRRIVSIDPGRTVLAERRLDPGDDCLNAEGVLPPVLVVEMMAQAGGLLMEEDPGPADLAMLAGVRDMRFDDVARSGETVTVECRLVRRQGTLWMIDGAAHVPGRLLARGTILIARTRRETAA